MSAATSTDLTVDKAKVLEAADQGRVEVSTAPSKKGEFQTMATKYSKRITYSRGSVLAWSKDYVEWFYNGSSISSSSGWQDSGWIFPNLVRVKGITKYYSSSPLHKYRAKKTISAGTVTPWGDVTLYSKDYTDYISVRGNGSYSVN
ncbi:hypothetical protein N1I86_14290 [Bacillus sp. FSL W8-0116]|uniref:hypothetical protein n=1 Tax=Bacillus sp. FSL W8-0116 TaxID=2978206 RepID=UPI0030F8B3F5